MEYYISMNHLRSDLKDIQNKKIIMYYYSIL